MKSEPVWNSAPFSLESISCIPVPRRSGHRSHGDELLIWGRSYPLWYALLTSPLLFFSGWLAALNLPEDSNSNQGALKVLALAFSLILLALVLFFLTARIELKVNAKEMLFRRAVMGLGKWDRMPQASVTKVSLRSQMLTEGLSYTDSGTAYQLYQKNTGLVIVGKDEWDLSQSLNFEQAQYFKVLLMAALQHFRKQVKYQDVFDKYPFD